VRILVVVLLILLTCDGGWSQKRRSALMPNIQTIGEGVIWRVSDNRNQQGNTLLPWKEIQVTNVFGFKQRPKIGDRVTVIPLDVDFAPLDLTILRTGRGTDCDGDEAKGADVWWTIDLEPIKQKKYFEYSALPKRREEVPFDVAVIYPAVKFARQIRRIGLNKSMLPSGVSLDTVEAAIDLTNDGIPDVLIVKYCCGQPKKSAEECDYTCGKTFKKVRKRWKQVDTSAPC